MLAVAASPYAAPFSAQDGYADAIVMFGAHWCAPCTGEVRRLPELAAAAAPDRIVMAWIDHPITPSPATTGVASLPPDVARRLAQNLLGDGYGLPISVMFDPHGAACAIRRSPLSPEEIAKMRLQCALSK
jgi:hypothetical protein